ncbi:MAG: hypothetical protein ACT4OQ_09105 [Chloroflexota bacterium]
MLDADHAQLQSHWKGWLERHGWLVDAELTFNHYGERGSIDLYAWHPASRTLLVIEIKTAIVDVQSLLASVDRKVRICWPARPWTWLAPAGSGSRPVGGRGNDRTPTHPRTRQSLLGLQRTRSHCAGLAG